MDNLKNDDDPIKKELERYRNLLEHARDIIFTIDPEGMITSLNPAFENILGWFRTDWIGKSYMPIVHPDDLPLAREIHRRTFNREIIPEFELRILSKSGKYLTFDFIITPLIGGVGGLGIARDITERRKIDEALKQSEKEYRTLVENIQDGVIVIQDEKIQFASKTFVKTAGYNLADVIGRNFTDFIAPEDLEMVADYYHRRQAGDNIPREYEFRILHKDEYDRIVVSVNVGLITYRGKLASMVTVKNITEKKKLEDQLLRAQRMESIGTLAGGIAHDLNNILTPMMLSLQLLKGKLKDDQSQKLITILENNSRRGANLVKQVMLFARGVEGERKPLNIGHIISEIEKVVKETFDRNIDIHIYIPNNLWPISGDATQLHQLIMNLCVNARDAMPGGGILSISAENFYVDESYSSMNVDAIVGQYIIIKVSDTGSGISPKIIDKIFEPFFTTKDAGKGTGLGLSISLGIVKSHGGFIDVQSEVDKGTTFKIFLPAIKADMRISISEESEFPIGKGEVILVAEDEGSIREITSSTLEAYGYAVITAEDGAEAVATYAENIDKIKVILMDLMMPVLDGQSSIRAIRKINPEVKIIAVSGLTDKDKLKNVLDFTNAFLAKPYTAEDLLKIIHDVIGIRSDYIKGKIQILDETIIGILINKKKRELAINVPSAGTAYEIKLGRELSSKDIEEYISAGQINLEKLKTI